MNRVRYKRGDTPRLTDEYKEEVKELFLRPDEEIDYSDIPEADDDFLRKAIKNPLYAPKKAPAYIKLDADVLFWLKREGPGYQTRMNAILREAMEKSLFCKAR